MRGPDPVNATKPAMGGPLRLLEMPLTELNCNPGFVALRTDTPAGVPVDDDGVASSTEFIRLTATVNRPSTRRPDRAEKSCLRPPPSASSPVGRDSCRRVTVSVE